MITGMENIVYQSQQLEQQSRQQNQEMFGLQIGWQHFNRHETRLPTTPPPSPLPLPNRELENVRQTHASELQRRLEMMIDTQEQEALQQQQQQQQQQLLLQQRRNEYILRNFVSNSVSESEDRQNEEEVTLPIVGHRTLSACLWGDGIAHKIGDCSACDGARDQEDQEWFLQLASIFVCREKITSRAIIGAKNTIACCIYHALDGALMDIFPETLMPLIASYCVGTVSQAAMIEPLRSSYQRLYECQVVKRDGNLEMQLEIKRSGAAGRLRRKMFAHRTETSSDSLDGVPISAANPDAIQSTITTDQNMSIEGAVATADVSKHDIKRINNADELTNDETDLTDYGKLLVGKAIAMYTNFAVQFACNAVQSGNDILLMQTAVPKHWTSLKWSSNTWHIHVAGVSAEQQAPKEIAQLSSSFLNGDKFALIQASTPETAADTIRAMLNAAVTPARSAGRELCSISFGHFEANGGPRQLHVTIADTTAISEPSKNMHEKVADKSCQKIGLFLASSGQTFNKFSLTKPVMDSSLVAYSKGKLCGDSTMTAATVQRQYKFVNVRPSWMADVHAHVLHFGHNRVSEKSVKNLKLAATGIEGDKRHLEASLQFGRTRDRNVFILDLRYPFSPIQAFAVAIASIEARL